MVQNIMRLGLSLPTAMHDNMRKLSFRRSAEAERAVTLSELYAEAVTQLAALIEGGEHVIFPQNPRGSTSRLTIRVPAEIVAHIDKYAPASSKSAVVATAALRLLQAEG